MRCAQFAGAALAAGLFVAAAGVHAAEWQDQAADLQRQILDLVHDQLHCLDRRIDGLQAPTLAVSTEEQLIADQWELNLSVDFETASDGVLMLVLQPSRPMDLPVVLDGDPEKCRPLLRSASEGTFVCTAQLDAGAHRWGLNGSATEGVERFDIRSQRLLIANEAGPPPEPCID